MPFAAPVATRFRARPDLVAFDRAAAAVAVLAGAAATAPRLGHAAAEGSPQAFAALRARRSFLARELRFRLSCHDEPRAFRVALLDDDASLGSVAHSLAAAAGASLVTLGRDALAAGVGEQ